MKSGAVSGRRSEVGEFVKSTEGHYQPIFDHSLVPSAGIVSGGCGINVSCSVRSVLGKLALLTAVLLPGLLVENRPAVHAQGIRTDWEPPAVLFDAERLAQVFSPFVFQDTEGSVKVLWEVSVDGTTDPGELVNGIYCISGDGSNWSQPVDVIAASGGGRAFWPRHVLDAYGWLHLVWVGPNAQLFHSQVPSSEACDARAWLTRVVPAASQVMYADIGTGSNDTLHVTYAALGKDVYYLSSADGGFSWSTPVAVSQVSPTAATSVPGIAVGQNGAIHIVWEEDQLPNGVPSLGLYYARSEDDGQTWTPALRFSQAQGEYTEPAVSLTHEGVIHLLWNGKASTKGRYHQQSLDGGRTWSQPDEFVAKALGGGQTGAPGVAIDSAGRLHVVTGTDETTYTALTQGGWLPPRDIAAFETFGGTEDQDISVVDGNQLYVVASAEFKQILLIRGLTDAPRAQPHYAPRPGSTSGSVMAQDTPMNEQAPLSKPTESLPMLAAQAAQQSTDSLPPLMLSAGLTFIVVAVVVVVNVRRRR